MSKQDFKQQMDMGNKAFLRLTDALAKEMPTDDDRACAFYLGFLGGALLAFEAMVGPDDVKDFLNDYIETRGSNAGVLN